MDNDFEDMVVDEEIQKNDSGGSSKAKNTVSLLERLEGELDIELEKEFLDNMQEIVGELKEMGFEHTGIQIIDTGPGRTSKCQYCGTAIRYEYYVYFKHDDEDEQIHIMVGSTCVHHFEDIIGQFDDRRAQKLYKEYRDTYMDIHDLEEGEETEVPAIMYDELKKKISKLRKQRKIKKIEESEHGDVFKFVREHKDVNKFYENVYNAILGGYVTDSQINAIRKEMEDDSRMQDERDPEDVVDMMVFKSFLELKDKGVFDLEYEGRDDSEFMQSIYNQYVGKNYISEKQRYWVDKLIDRHIGLFSQLVKKDPSDDFECSEDDCDGIGIKFDDRKFGVCENGHLTRHIDDLGMDDIELEKVEVVEEDE